MMFRNTEVLGRDHDHDTLFVVMHGWRCKVETHMDHVKSTIRETGSGQKAHILSPLCPDGTFWNTAPLDVAKELSHLIERTVESQRTVGKAYRRIILVGYGTGSLLVRKAFVIARGENQEFSEISPPERSWPDLVERIVLLAGMNRGWTLSPKPEHMPLGVYIMGKLLYPVTKLPFCCRFIRDLERGSPFVANLRIQWLNLRAGSRIPMTVQILGDRDDIISREDNVDVQVASDFYFIEVHATHATLINFVSPDYGDERRESFSTAISSDAEEIRRRSNTPKVPRLDGRTEGLVGHELQHGREIDGATVDDVLFVMHGIRDAGVWTADFRQIARHSSLNTTALSRGLRSFSSNALGFAGRFRP